MNQFIKSIYSVRKAHRYLTAGSKSEKEMLRSALFPKRSLEFFVMIKLYCIIAIEDLVTNEKTRRRSTLALFSPRVGGTSPLDPFLSFFAKSHTSPVSLLMVKQLLLLTVEY